MNTCSTISPADLHRGALSLVLHPSPTLNGQLLELAADLAAACLPLPTGQIADQSRNSPSHLLVLDGGNCFNIYPVARLLRRRTSKVNAALEIIRVARAFTCFEMASLLKRSAYQSGPTPAAVLVLGFLSTFQDENVALPERQRLLRTCLPPLRRLVNKAPLLVTARPADADPDHTSLISILLQGVDQLLELEVPAQQPGQLPLPLDGTDLSTTKNL
jgi:hypothetical protein